MKLPLILLLACAMLQAQTAQPKIDYTCSPEDVDDFGLACSEDEPCAIFLELSAVEGVGNSVFLTGNLHTVSTTLYGIVMGTSDAGQTWTQATRIRAASLEQIQLLDFANGWISGVKLEPLPRDPFLLVTTDGGKTWRERPLFEDTRYGSIQQFGFTSAKAGELILDRSQGATKRYERYRSDTGGESWEVQESGTQPMKVGSSRPEANRIWRLRTDSAAKAYRVERRTADNKWEVVSSFAINVAECK